MTDLPADPFYEAMERMIDEAREAEAIHNAAPSRILVTRASVPGTILLVPEEAAINVLYNPEAAEHPSPRRELRVHPDDWRLIQGQANAVASGVTGRLGQLIFILGIPVVIEDGAMDS